MIFGDFNLYILLTVLDVFHFLCSSFVGGLPHRKGVCIYIFFTFINYFNSKWRVKLNCEPCSNVVALIEIATSLLALNRDASWYFSHIRTVFLFEGTWGISHSQGGTLT